MNQVLALLRMYGKCSIKVHCCNLVMFPHDGLVRHGQMQAVG